VCYSGYALFSDNVLPLVKEVMNWFTDGCSTSDVLLQLYNFLIKIKKFKEAVKLAAKFGVKKALKDLNEVKNELVEVCKEDKKIIKALSEVATKGVVRHAAICTGARVALQFGVSKVGSQTIKSATEIANPLGLVADGTQCVLEYCGYKEEGKAIGKFGNIGTGALAGFMIGGPVGIGIGALVGYGTWAIGEAVGRKINTALN